MEGMDPRDETRTPGTETPGGAGPGAEPVTGRAKVEGRGGGRRVLWWLLAVAVAFLAGFGWQYYRAMTIEDQLAQTEKELAVERLRVGLAQAAVAAQSGDFEAARRQMSDFFTSMQAQLAELPEEVRTVGEDLLRSRDKVITDLSRSDPAAADALYGMLQRFRLSLGEAPVPIMPPTPADTGTAAKGS